MTQNGWGGLPPTQVADSDDYELGTEYRANVDVTLTHIRVFSGASPSARPLREGRIWTTAGVELGRAAMAENLPAGWALYALDTPVSISAGQRFIVSYNTTGNYSALTNALTGNVDSLDDALTALATGQATNGNGVFGSLGNFPTTNVGPTFYGIDVGYDVVGGNTAPTITTLDVTTSGLAASATISATDPQTLTGATYSIDWGDGTTTDGASGTFTHTYTTGGLKAVLGGITDVGGLSDFMAVPLSLIAPADGWHPNSELVAVAWLKAAVPSLGTRVATELPRATETWSASGFTTVAAAGGSAPLYTPLRSSVLDVTCWGVAPKSGRPPWNQASQMAEAIMAAVLDHPTVPLRLTLPTGYRAALVRSAWLVTEPRRAPGDAGDFARYTLDLALDWVEVPP